MAPVPVPAKDAPPTGNAIFVMAVLVVVVSSGLALVMAHLFRSGYPYQCSVLAVQQMVCTAFGAFMMGQRPEEAAKLRISRWNYLTMLLPFSGVLSLKLFLQNKAVQYVSPAFYAMTGSLLPVGVTMLSIAIGSAKFKWSTVAAAAVVSVGGVLIKFGQVELSTIGFVLTISSLGLDVVRLLLMQALLQPLRLSGMATMLLSAPQQCLLFFVNAAWADGARGGAPNQARRGRGRVRRRLLRDPVRGMRAGYHGGAVQPDLRKDDLRHHQRHLHAVQGLEHHRLL
jgi:drug/metabolite transporter (DMT)-like permease